MSHVITNKLKLSVTSEKNVTIDDLVREAGIIWKDVRRRKLNVGKTDETTALLKEIQTKYRQFCTAYPIVVRYMCQMQEYDSQTFRLWLGKIQLHPWKTTEEYIDAQTDYVVRLFRSRKPRSNNTEVGNLRTNIKILLTQEHNAIKKSAEEGEATVTKNEKYLHDRNADELFEFASNISQEGMQKAETYQVITDMIATEKINLDDLIGVSYITDITADDLLS